MLVDVLLDILYGALAIGGLVGFFLVGITYWSVVGPILVAVYLLSMALLVGKLIRD